MFKYSLINKSLVVIGGTTGLGLSSDKSVVIRFTKSIAAFL